MKIEAEQRYRVAVCVPCEDRVNTEFAFSLAAMVNWTHANPVPGLEALGLINRKTSVLPDSRNMLATQALEDGFTHLLWIDSDMRFPPDMLARMMRHRVDYVSVNCSMRRPPFNTTAMTGKNERMWTNEHSTGLEKVQRVGLGVAFHSAEVLRRIRKRPWFTFDYVPAKGIHRGEDYTFCHSVRKAGFEIWVDQDLSKEVRHMGEMAYSPIRDEDGRPA